MGKFARTLKAATRQTDNAPAAARAKAVIRQDVLDLVGRDAAVLDVFAGEGRLYHEVWHQAGRYVGCDRKWYRDERVCYVADNRRVLRAIDLAPFRIFDLDAYGAPWEQAIIIAARRRVEPGELIGLCLTEGSALKVKMGTLPFSLSQLSGLHPKVVGAARRMDEVLNRAIHGIAGRMECEIVTRLQADGRKGSSMRYIGLVLRGRAAS